MLSIVVKEHNETVDKIGRIIEQASNIPIEKELIFVTSKTASEFSYILETLSSERYNLTIRYIPSIKNSGEAVTLGAQYSRGDNILVIDCHVCFSPDDTIMLIDTLERNPDSMVTPGIYHTDFPSCIVSNNKIVDDTAIGYGSRIRISSGNSFEWIWLPKQKDTV